MSLARTEPEHPTPEPPESGSDAAELLRRLKGVVPPWSKPFRDGETVALTWNDPCDGSRVNVLAVEGGSVGYVASLCPREGLARLARWVAEQDAGLPLLLLNVRRVRPYPMPEVDAVLTLAATSARRPDVVLAMDDLGLTRPEAAAWLSHPELGAVRMAACRVHPWLAGPMVGRSAMPGPRGRLVDRFADAPHLAGPAFVEAWLTTDPESAAWLCRAMADMPVGHALGGQPKHRDEAYRAFDLMRLLRLPPRLRPGGPGMPGGSDAVRAAMACCGMLVPLALMTRRDIASVAGKVGSWPGYLARCCARAGMDEWFRLFAIDPSADRQFETRATDLARCVTDMVTAFGSQVVRPALMADGRDATRRTVTLDDMSSVEVADAAAARLLLGLGTYPALAETSRTWHRRMGDVTRLLTRLRGAGAPDGPAAFPDVELGDGTYATCLHRTIDLADEGATGPDASGADGLAHCVGSYCDDVLAGSKVIVSVRRRLPDGGYLRLSTAELDVGFAGVRTVQHLGRANAPVAPGDTDRLVAALSPHAAAAGGILAAWKAPDRPPPPDTADLVHRAGAWEEMRDLWAFALPRGLRQATPAQFLDAAGLDAAGDLSDLRADEPRFTPFGGFRKRIS